MNLIFLISVFNVFSLDVKPWEISNNFGDIVLPDIYYAEESENEQITPFVFDDDRLLIKNLIYPTQGNPVLVNSNDHKSELLVVFRLPISMLPPLDTCLLSNQTNKFICHNFLKQSSIYIFNKTNRFKTTSDNYIESNSEFDLIDLATNVLIHDPSFSPKQFSNQFTAELRIPSNKLTRFNEDLYDIRLEIRQEKYRRVEYHFNSVSLKHTIDSEDNFNVLSLADTQLTTRIAGLNKLSGQPKTEQAFRQFILHQTKNEYLDSKKIPFAIFNGDLVNGGAIALFRPSRILNNYRDEYIRALEILKDLNFPIFLTPGNHDGHSSFGKTDKLHGSYLPKIKKTLPDLFFELKNYLHNFPHNNYLIEEENIFQGNSKRHPLAEDQATSYIEINSKHKVFYDGQYFWRKFFGPLYYSFSYKNYQFLSLNSYDLRQHDRVGHGMYVASHGGSISPTQYFWLKREIKNAQSRDKNVVILSHHDPRGGSEDKFRGHYHYQKHFLGIWKNMMAFLKGGKDKCKEKGDCFEDGLHEWMLTDPRFDCQEVYLFQQKECDNNSNYFFSGPEIVELLASSPKVKTVIMGHVHYLDHKKYIFNESILPEHNPHKTDAKDVINEQHTFLLTQLNSRLRELKDNVLTEQDWIKVPALTTLPSKDPESNKKMYGYGILNFNHVGAKNFEFFTNDSNGMYSLYKIKEF